ncbi:hypothetical protein LA080_001828 [Diaporthe eres]|nr:hypothetical protein LA080_001828 [Diaporthe eres]
MSGIEVAGLVLGALPLVLKSVDAYRGGFRRFGTTFNKRKHVEKLARALLLQQRTLEELIKSVVLASGCEDVLALDDDPVGYLKNPDVQEQVEEYLGPKSTSFLVDELEVNSEAVGKVARRISGLVPGGQGLKDDLIAIIEANHAKPSLRADLTPRITLVLGITDMRDMIQEIDKGTDALDRFSRLTLPNRQSMNSNSSRNSMKLAKAFRQIRKLSEGLYTAILDSFQDKCHESHEARLYLDGHIDTAHRLLQRRSAVDSAAPQMMFDLVFHAEGQKDDTLYYETVVQVFDDYKIDDVYHETTPEDLVKAVVTFSVTDARSTCKPKVATISSICETIKEACGMKSGISFALLGNRQMGTFPDQKAMPGTRTLCQVDHRDCVSLSQTLKTSSTLPLKPRMQLSLQLASSLLQLLSTPWLTQAWCKHTVFFLLPENLSGPTSHAKQNAQVDLNRPLVVCSFSGECPVVPPMEPKAALLELGILLLEIWHGMTLESRFGLDESISQSQSMKYYERLVKALEWQDDGTNPMLGLYGQAVSKCLTGNNLSAGKLVDWEDSKL